MSESPGEQLTQLNRGDSVAITVEYAQYGGSSRHELPGEYILMTATETVPQSWEVPQAYVYEPIENETATVWGTVAEVEIGTNRQ